MTCSTSAWPTLPSRAAHTTRTGENILLYKALIGVVAGILP